MAIDTAMSMSAQLSMRVSPSLIAFSHILGLSAVQLERLVEEELADNPALERAEVQACRLCGSNARPCCEADRPARPAGEHGALSRAGVDGNGSGLAALPHRASDAEQLLGDVLLVVAPEDRRVAAYVAHSLDERGFLPESPFDIALRLAVPVERVKGVIDAMRNVGPPGVAAENVRECLLLQIDDLQRRGDVPPLVRPLVADHLDQLALGKVRSVAAALGVTTVDVEAALDFVRERLRPFVTFSSAGPVQSRSLPPPDVVIEEHPDAPGEFRIEVVLRARALVAIDPFYARLAARLRRQAQENVAPGEREQIVAAVARARNFLNRLGRRDLTLKAVAEAVVARQRDFIIKGPAAHAPLTRSEVAEQVGLHESTVSRATAGKTVRLPDHTIVPFSAFFGSSSSAQAALREVVATEVSPLTDMQLATELAARGHRLARRTVAKYRADLGIPACSRR